MVFTILLAEAEAIDSNLVDLLAGCPNAIPAPSIAADAYIHLEIDR